MKTLRIVVVSLLLAGCVGKTVTLVNAEGQTVECSVSTGTAFATGVPARDAMLKSCVRSWEQKGYTKQP